MKKLHFLLKTILLLCALIAGSNCVWATDPVIYTLQLSSEKKISSSGLTDGIIVWTATNNNASIGNNFSSGYSGEQFGTGSTQGNVVLSTSSISGTITKVVVTSQTGTSGGATVAVSVGGTSWGSKSMKVATSATGSTPGDLEFTGSNTGTVQITLTQTVQKAMYLNKIAITYIPVVETKVATPTISLEEGLYYGTKSVTLETTTTDADIYYTTNGTTPTSGSTKYTGAISVSTSQTIKAIGIKDGLEDSEVASAEYSIISSIPSRTPKNYNTNYFVKVTDFNELEDGDAVIFVDPEGVRVMGNPDGSVRAAVNVNSLNGIITSLPENAQKIVLIKVGNRLFFSTAENSYLYATSSGSNHIGTGNEATAGANAMASIDIAANGDVTIVFLGDKTRNHLKYNYNGGSPRFSCYDSSSSLPVVHLYKEQAIAGPSNPVVEGSTVTLTTTANMDGWRSFIGEADQNYTIEDGAKVYYVSETNAGTKKVTLTEIAEGIPANTPVILHKDGATSITLTKTATPIAAPSGNKLAVSTAGQNLSAGVYRLGFKTSYGVGFYKYSSASAPAGIIYISALDAGANFLSFDFGDVTGIESLTPAPSPKGEGSEYYNLNGQRVAQPTKGLYIVNGKKVVIK